MSSKILIVGSTHGHERIGLEVIKELKSLNIDTNYVDFEIGNIEASKKDVRFIESDLNRVFPGKENGTYEERRAFDLSKKIFQTDVVIDIHSTNTSDLGSNSTVIVTKYDEATRDIIAAINPPKVLYMKYKSDNALISQAKVGIAFEYGEDNSKKVLDAIIFDICEIFCALSILPKNPYTNPRTIQTTEVFEVYDIFPKTFTGTYTLDSAVENFRLCKKDSTVCITSHEEIVIAEEDFYPVLFGEKSYTEILGFKAKKLR
jgi:hypothetical protein